MICKKILLLLSFLLVSNLVNAGAYLGFGIGYTAKNVYKDIIGLEQSEKGIPLLAANFGFSGGISIATLEAGIETNFFGMDLVKGNTEITLFAKPQAMLYVPLKMGKSLIAATLGYGGIYSRRFIKERVYLSVDKQYLEPANYEDYTIEPLYGGRFCYGDWLKVSMLFSKDINEFYRTSLLIRTPKCKENAPYIGINYCRSQASEIFTLGLITFF